MREISLSELSHTEIRALHLASAAKEHAYNPYSHFYVGACLYGYGDMFVVGANVENAAYGSTICAERSAILHANAKGRRRFDGIAIIARGETFDTKEVTAPCGSCRQMLYELSQVSGNDLTVILATTRFEKIVKTSIRELLPLAFGPMNLGIDIARFNE